jgi:hypothetical protein
MGPSMQPVTTGPSNIGLKTGEPLFDRPSGTEALCIATQALRAWLRSACPSSLHPADAGAMAGTPGQKPFAHTQPIHLVLAD